jgi:hypothetical protein
VKGKSSIKEAFVVVTSCPILKGGNVALIAGAKAEGPLSFQAEG